MKTKHIASILILAAAAFTTVSCKEQPQASTTPAEKSAAPKAPSAAFQQVLATAPKEKSGEIHVVRTSAKPGDEITLTGRIMGNSKPFVEGRAAFIIADTGILTACSDKPGDNCDTPWDACCNTKEEKKIALATIQIVDAEGRVLKEEIEDQSGLKKLGNVTVTGKVAEGSSADSLVVNATAIRVEE